MMGWLWSGRSATGSSRRCSLLNISIVAMTIQAYMRLINPMRQLPSPSEMRSAKRAG